MAGQHQVANASFINMASLLLQKHYPKVTPELHVAPGSCQLARSNRILRPNLMIDGAHNEMLKFLIDLLQSEYADKEIELLLLQRLIPSLLMVALAQLKSAGDLTVPILIIQTVLN